MEEGLEGDTGALEMENGTIGGTFDKGALKNIVADKSNTFTMCLLYHILQHRQVGCPNQAQAALPMM
jgi:hypothetical protein